MRLPQESRQNNLRLPDLDALVDEEPHDLGAASPRRVVQRVVAPLGAGVEVGPRPQQQIQDVDPAVVCFVLMGVISIFRWKRIIKSKYKVTKSFI